MVRGWSLEGCRRSVVNVAADHVAPTVTRSPHGCVALSDLFTWPEQTVLASAMNGSVTKSQPNARSGREARSPPNWVPALARTLSGSPSLEPFSRRRAPWPGRGPPRRDRRRRAPVPWNRPPACAERRRARRGGRGAPAAGSSSRRSARSRPCPAAPRRRRRPRSKDANVLRARHHRDGAAHSPRRWGRRRRCVRRRR